jgi:hypothetical protein
MMPRVMRILLVADRLSDRGGADWHLLGIVRALAGGHTLLTAVGRTDIEAPEDCPVRIIPGLRP